MSGYNKGKVKVGDQLIDRDKALAPRPGIPLDKEKVKSLLIKYRGNITRTAISLGCSRKSILTLSRTHDDVKEALEDARERVVDEVEDAFTQRAVEGDTTASIFFLKTRGRDRGYDQDFRADIEAVTRAALDFALNKSKNPAEA